MNRNRSRGGHFIHQLSGRGRRFPYRPSRAPVRCYPGLAVLTRNARTLVPGAKYARRESNPHQPGPQPGPSIRLRHERMEPLDRLERSPPGYDAGTLPGELQRHRCPPRIRTRLPASESGVLPIERMGMGCGRRESNAQAARFELARYARFPSLPHGAPPGT